MIKFVRNLILRHATPSHLAPRAPRKGVAQSGISLIGTAVFLLAAGFAGVSPALAEETLGSPIAAEDLAEIRGGDNDTTTNSHNTTLTAGSTQDTDANNSGNSIDAGGDVVAGNFHVQSGAFTDNRGMTNVVVNTAPQSNVQGIMTLNLVLQ